MAVKMLCDRPHVDTITREMRFVVSSSKGVNLGGGKVYMRGDEFPVDLVNNTWLKLLYSQRRIDLHPEQERSGEAHAPDQVGQTATAAAMAPEPETRKIYDEADLEDLSRDELAKLCKRHKIRDKGTKDELRSRLLALVA